MRARWPVAAALAAVMLAGCGGPSAEEEFRADLRPLQERIERDKAQISSQLQVARLGRADDAELVGALVERLRTDVNELGRLEAPESLGGLFREYVVAHRHLIASLERFGRLLAGDSEDALAEEADKTQSASGEVARSRAALDERLAGV